MSQRLERGLEPRQAGIDHIIVQVGHVDHPLQARQAGPVGRIAGSVIEQLQADTAHLIADRCKKGGRIGLRQRKIKIGEDHQEIVVVAMGPVKLAGDRLPRGVVHLAIDQGSVIAGDLHDRNPGIIAKGCGAERSRVPRQQAGAEQDNGEQKNRQTTATDMQQNRHGPLRSIAINKWDGSAHQHGHGLCRCSAAQEC